MRLKRNRLKTYSHRQAVARKDKEGVSIVEYGPASAFQAEEWPGGGKLQAEMYGIRLPSIRNLRIDGSYHEVTEDGILRYQIEDGPCITVNDGICLYVPGTAEPDYKVVAVYPYGHLIMEVEKL